MADYFVDKDPIFRGIIKGVYTPFSVSEWRLVGASEKTKAKYEEYYEKIGLRDKMWSIFYQYYKYGQTYVYLMEDGRLITLPPHRCRITNVIVDGEPVVEYNAQSVTNDIQTATGSSLQEWIKDGTLDERLKGYPKEVTTAVKDGVEWVQLNPARTYTLQEVKEDWLRYAVPMVSSCLPAFAKKALIESYEKTALNMGIHSFLHVTYGDDKAGLDLLPNVQELQQVNALFKSAMSKAGNGIATTNPYANAKFIQPDILRLFENDLFSEVNGEILSGGGISGIIVNGRAEDGSSFASAQVSMQTAALRIKQARDNFCELMNKINAKLNAGILPHSASGKVPKFTFPPVDLTGSGKLYEACLTLWKLGVVSTKTLLTTAGYDVDQELERRKAEDTGDVTKTLTPRETKATESDAVSTDPDGTKVGRPEMDDTERASDPADSVTGKQPKPSSPDGSM